MSLTRSTFWLGRSVGALSVLAVAALLVAVFVDARAPGRRSLDEHRRALGERLAFLRYRARGGQVLAAEGALAGAFLLAALFAESWFLIVPALVVAVLPKILLDRLSARRVGLLEAEIEAWLNAIAGALKASPSLGEAIESSLPLLPSPMSEEVDLVIKEYAFGTPLDRALANLADRVDSRTLAGSVLALQIARRSGGNLPEVLQSCAAALREMARLEGVVRTKTAEGKAQAFVIGALPVPLVYGIGCIDDHFFDPLYHLMTGHLVIAAAVVLWALAVLGARKILAVDI